MPTKTHRPGGRGRRRIARAAFAAVLLLAGVTAGAGAHAAPAPIVGTDQGRCLDVPGGSRAGGVQVADWRCNGTSHQRFSLEPAGDGYFSVIAEHSRLCLNVAGGVRANSAKVVQWSCGNGDNDAWGVERAGSGYRLVARHSDRCLTVDRRSRKLVQYDCDGRAGQSFKHPAFASAPAPVRGSGSLMVRSSGRCVGALDASTRTGARIVQSTCTGSAHQSYSLRRAGGDYFNIVADNTGLCLNVSGGDTRNGAAVIQWRCGRNGKGDNDAWRLQRAGTQYKLVARHSGRCLNVEGGSTNNGARLIQYDCGVGAGAGNDRFTIGALGTRDGGSWSRTIALPLVASAAGVLPDGRVLAWASSSPMSIGPVDVPNAGRTVTAIYDPADGSVSRRTVQETGHDMFCPGTSQLADGRIMVTGGSTSGRVSLFDPRSNAWTRAPDMNRARGYHSSATLGDGSVMVVGGSWSGGAGEKGAEVFRGNRWDMLDNVSTQPMLGDDPRGMFRDDNHMWLFAWTGQRVFQAGPSRRMHMISTAGEGGVTSVGTRGSDPYAMNGSAAMFAPGKILATGGAPSYDDGNGTRNAHEIDITSSTVRTRKLASMRQPRTLHHNVVLPTGEVLVVGGQEQARLFRDELGVLAPELFDPVEGTFRTLAPMRIPRNYHSVALLMPDARVFVGGGGLCGNGCQGNHADAEIFTPPYLIGADGRPAARPTIRQAPGRARYGATLAVQGDNDVRKFVLIRMSTSTHSVNTDQRRVPVTSRRTGNGRFEVTMPGQPGVAPPGNYLLFALNGAGVPSIGRIVNLSGS